MYHKTNVLSIGFAIGLFLIGFSSPLFSDPPSEFSGIYPGVHWDKIKQAFSSWSDVLPGLNGPDEVACGKLAKRAPYDGGELEVFLENFVVKIRNTC